MNKETKLRIHNITAKAALKFGSEAWVLKKREKQRLEATQMNLLRNLHGITGHAVAQLVEALHYKSEGRGFDSRWCHWNFSLT